MSVILTSSNSNLYVNGERLVGTQGPALFTLVTETGEPVLTPNSISVSNASVSMVKSMESYLTAFITCKVQTISSSQLSIGFMSTTFPNTFAFSFDIIDNVVYISYNGGGSQAVEASITEGDILSICLTSISCKYFINGSLVYQVFTDTNYLNVFATFYSVNNYSVSNISFGYLSDPVVG